MNNSGEKNKEKFHELGEISDMSNVETKINVESARSNKPEQKDNFVLKIRYAWQSLPKLYKAMAYLAIFNTLIISLLVYYSWD